MRKTKIVCTIGPVSESKEMLKKLAEAGMNVARLNFSHGDHEEHGNRIDTIRKVEAELGKPIGIMLDTKGPEIRTGMLKDDKVELKKGEEIILTTEDIEGDENRVSVSYKGLPDDLHEGATVLIDDGLIGLEVLEIKGTEIRCKIVNGGLLGSRKGVNLPGISVNLPALTEKDESDIRFGVRKGIHFIAASFVRKAQDVIEIRKILEEEGKEDILIIAKIENQEGVDNIDEIIDVADGIMVARGDLGVEIPAEQVPVIQKSIIKKCNEKAKPVITATQMLDSMIRNPRPTRAEASDVANAIFDGTDATMLSGESAAGDYPVEAVKTMARIAEETEKSLYYRDVISNRRTYRPQTVTDAISFASCETATDLGAQAIITSTESGLTARMVSRYRPLVPIVAVTPDERVQHALTVSWGVYPLTVKKSNSTDEMMDVSIKTAQENRLIKSGDLVVITAGAPVGIPGTTNLIKVDVVGEPLVEGQGVGKGIVTGQVKIAHTAKEAVEKIEEGDILVTGITDKEYLPAMKKAGAIIAEQGGLTSHPAIVGLELGIPVIVKAEKATENLVEGEIITIDGVRGLVYPGTVHLK
ncbi:pyruvate kinase [Halothermothrix orenii]|uniref:Pyruvate kinase n=1 Tax=Halothermothrix orenii (strain H 168 / OCM 544 / DSM 9562) TaxID=373903 RepID=B8D1K6_HALOH|nr:pyruvate kinase [Halothermothrix orenii]ACL69083.1 pyruvate kinase [Halothermothrix orenii H 168]